MTTLKDILMDFMSDIRENEHLDYEEQADPRLILDEYIDKIIKKLVKGGE